MAMDWMDQLSDERSFDWFVREVNQKIKEFQEVIEQYPSSYTSWLPKADNLQKIVYWCSYFAFILGSRDEKPLLDRRIMSEEETSYFVKGITDFEFRDSIQKMLTEGKSELEGSNLSWTSFVRASSKIEEWATRLVEIVEGRVDAQEQERKRLREQRKFRSSERVFYECWIQPDEAFDATFMHDDALMLGRMSRNLPLFPSIEKTVSATFPPLSMFPVSKEVHDKEPAASMSPIESKDDDDEEGVEENSEGKVEVPAASISPIENKHEDQEGEAQRKVGDLKEAPKGIIRPPKCEIKLIESEHEDLKDEGVGLHWLILLRELFVDFKASPSGTRIDKHLMEGVCSYYPDDFPNAICTSFWREVCVLQTQNEDGAQENAQDFQSKWWTSHQYGKITIGSDKYKHRMKTFEEKSAARKLEKLQHFSAHYNNIWGSQYFKYCELFWHSKRKFHPDIKEMISDITSQAERGKFVYDECNLEPVVMLFRDIVDGDRTFDTIEPSTLKGYSPLE